MNNNGHQKTPMTVNKLFVSWPDSVLAILLRSTGLCLLISILSACGGGSGAENQVNEQAPDFDLLSQSAIVEPYSGPSPASVDAQQFKREFWEKLRPDNRCGACHGTGGQTPEFVREDDVNLAMDAALGVINTDSVSESVLIQKVAGGHNCWETSTSACADILIRYVNAWLGDSAGSANTIELRSPTIKDPGSSKNFPSDPGNFTALHNELTTYCSNCHSDTAAIPISPYFASSDIDIAYGAAQSKIDLDTPANSRLVIRLGTEFHNCWSDCASNAADMLNAIQQLTDSISTTEVAPEIVHSKALTLQDGLIISSGGRVESDLIALYQFKTGSGTTLFDTSGVEPALNLTVYGIEGIDFDWVGGWGMQFKGAKAQGNTQTSRKLFDQLSGPGEYSIEAWVAPANVSQSGPAVIVGYSGGSTARNFTLGQTLYNYEFMNRSSNTDAMGEPSLATPDADEVLQATLQHVVATFSPVDGRKLYVNGELVDVNQPDSSGGNLNDWDETFALVLANETSNNRTWLGTFRMLAIHSRALTADEIQQNFAASVGERFYLLFDISSIINVNSSYIVFEVSQFDNYSYLFSKPFYVSLDSSAQPSNIPLQHMRIGINGREASVGQAYVNLVTSIDRNSLDENGYQALSTLGTVIGLEKGPQDDEFFLTFEQLGSATNVVVESDPLPPPPVTEELEQADIGLRTFDEVNATMSAITGIPTTHADVAQTFGTVRQQLPSVETIEGFLSAHQMAITQLAIEYCNALVSDPAERVRFFPDALFARDANSVSSAEWDTQVIDPLLNAVLLSNVATQPDIVDVRSDLNLLITDTADNKPFAADPGGSDGDGIPDGLARCGGPCGTERTATVVKATCAAALGSAAMLLQ